MTSLAEAPPLPGAMPPPRGGGGAPPRGAPPPARANKAPAGKAQKKAASKYSGEEGADAGGGERGGACTLRLSEGVLGVLRHLTDSRGASQSTLADFCRLCSLLVSYLR